MKRKKRPKPSPRKAGTSPGMTVGRSLLVRMGLTQEEIAEQIGVDDTLVAHWMRGARLPTSTKRIAIERLLHIPAGAWDREAPKDALPVRTPYMPLTVGQRAHQLDEEIHRLLEDRRGEPYTRAKVLRSCMGALSMLSKITGADITEAMILKSTAWRKLEAAIERALTPHPEAMKALAETLAELLEG